MEMKMQTQDTATKKESKAGHGQTKWIVGWMMISALILSLMPAVHAITVGSITFDLLKLKQKCKHDECRLSAKVTVTNNGASEVEDIHVRFFLSANDTFENGVDTLVTADDTGSIKAGKRRNIKLKESIGSSASGLVLLVVDDTDAVVAFEPIP